MVGIGFAIAAAATASPPPVLAPPPPIVAPPPPVFAPTLSPDHHLQIYVPPLPKTAETLPYSIKGKWHVRVDMTLDGGCFTNVVFDDFTYLRLSFVPTQRAAYFMIGNTKWRSLQTETARAVAVGLDAFTPWTADATPHVIGNITYLWMEIPETRFLDQLGKAKTLRLQTAERLIGTYELSGSGEALAELIKCQKFVEKTVDPFLVEK